MTCLMRRSTGMCIGCFPAISALMFPLILLKGKRLLPLWRVRCSINPGRQIITRQLWTSEPCSVRRSRPTVLFCPLSGSCRALSEGKVQQLPVKQHRTKTTNRYFNYIYVRMGAHTLIHKRTEDDIWKNLFELPLVETEKDLSEEEFLACPQFHALFAEGEVRMVRILLRGVKHVLSHRVIYTNFYEVTLPDNSSSFSSYQRVAVEDLGRYAVPRLIHAFLEKYV